MSMDKIKELKRKYDNYEIEENQIAHEDKVKIAKLYKEEIEQIRESIEYIKKETERYRMKIKAFNENNL